MYGIQASQRALLATPASSRRSLVIGMRSSAVSKALAAGNASGASRQHARMTPALASSLLTLGVVTRADIHASKSVLSASATSSFSRADVSR